MEPLPPPKCPVCDRPMTVTRSLLDEGTVAESAEECPNGCYTYDYSYGSTVIRVGRREFFGHYAETVDEFRERQIRVKLAVTEDRNKRQGDNP